MVGLEELQKESPFTLRTQQQVLFAEQQLNKPQGFWKNEKFGHIWLKNKHMDTSNQMSKTVLKGWYLDLILKP